jgi:hypothetical protein
MHLKKNMRSIPGELAGRQFIWNHHHKLENGRQWLRAVPLCLREEDKEILRSLSQDTDLDEQLCEHWEAKKKLISLMRGMYTLMKCH